MQKKKSGTERIPYDSEKLRFQIESHNYTLSGLSLDLGYGKAYLGNAVNRAESFSHGIPRRTVILLETVGIHYKDYEPDTTPVIPKEPEDDPLPWDVPEDKTITVKLDEEQFARLAVIIREQVYEAVRKAWSE